MHMPKRVNHAAVRRLSFCTEIKVERLPDIPSKTFDQQTHMVHLGKEGRTVKAWLNVDGKHIKGSGRTESEALNAWASCYKFTFDS